MPDVYVHLADGAVDRTREVADGVCVDHASSGEVIGVEVLGARSVDIDGKPLAPSLAVDRLALADAVEVSAFANLPDPIMRHAIATNAADALLARYDIRERGEQHGR